MATWPPDNIITQSGNYPIEKNPYSNLINALSSERGICISPFLSTESIAVGHGTIAFSVPSFMNGLNLINVLASVHTQGITGSTNIQVRRRRNGSDIDMLTGLITLGSEYYISDESIDTENDDINTGDQIYIDIDQVHSGTAPKGLSVTLTFI